MSDEHVQEEELDTPTRSGETRSRKIVARFGSYEEAKAYADKHHLDVSHRPGRRVHQIRRMGPNGTVFAVSRPV